MVHTSWTGQDGAPQDIRALAQTPDGTLWIASTAGLFGFDGIHFSAFATKHGEPAFPSNAIRSLFVSKQGDLWIVGSYVGVARLSGGHLTIFGDKNIRLFQIQQDSEGIVWGIRNYRDLVKLTANETWLSVRGPLKRSGYVSTLFIDSSDTQWVSAEGRLYRRTRGSVDFQPTNIFTDEETTFTEDSDHVIWIRGNRLRVGTSRESSSVLRMDQSGNVLATTVQWGSVSELLRPGDGSIWIANPGQGISRVKLTALSAHFALHEVAKRESYSALDGLSSNAVHALFRDADGNVWAGGLKGLDRFEHATLLALTKTSQTGNWSTCTNPQGEVWVESDDTPLSVLRNGNLHTVHPAGGYSKLLCTSTGDVWFLNRDGIGVIHNHEFDQLPTLPGHTQYGTLYNFIAFDESSDKALIASVGSATERGLWKFREGGWTRFAPDLFTGFAHALFADHQGRLYVGRTDGEIFVLSDTQPLLIRNESSFMGVISAFSRTSYGLFALGAEGIAIERNNSFHELTFVRPDLAKTTTGLVESNDGDIWLNGSRGIVRVPRSEVLAALADTKHMIVGSEWHEGDYIGPAPFNNSTASAAKGWDGRLWFSTLNGVVSLRTEDTRASARPPHVSISAIVADDRPPDAHNTFRPNPHTLRIQYFGLNLTRPQQVIYRYRLEGVDDDWQSVSNRTEALYTRLKPGRYVFQVEASNADGNWTAPVSTSFTIAHTFYQTFWFAGLCIAAGIFAVWLLLAARLRFLAGAIRMRAEERADERIRIARELHDTLLQGVQGLILTFHVAAQKLPTNDESKLLMERALLTADELLIEGRNRVSELRAEHLTDPELLHTIEVVASHLAAGKSINVDVSRTGGQWTLQPQIVDEVFYIAREALTNAFRHSEATHVTVELNYANKAFTLTCRDNGRGFTEPEKIASSRESHWGIWGMRERASNLGGSIRWDSVPHRGTAVLLSIPSSRAYQLRPGLTSQLTFLRRSS